VSDSAESANLLDTLQNSEKLIVQSPKNQHVVALGRQNTQARRETVGTLALCYLGVVIA